MRTHNTRSVPTLWAALQGLQFTRTLMGPVYRSLVAVVLAIGMVPGEGHAQTLIDISAAGAGSGAALCTASFEHNGACFEQGDGSTSSGTGIFDPFYQVQSANVVLVSGVNTAGRPAQFETVENGAGAATELLLSTVTQVDVGGVRYREFFLDINQTSGNAIYDILELQMYTDDEPDLTCLNPATQDWEGCDAGDDAELIYWLDDPAGEGDASVRMNYSLEAGSGKRDLRMLIPDADFNAGPECDYGQEGCGLYVYLYSQFNPNDDGFEEWSTAIQPFIQISKTANGSLEEETQWTIDKSVSPDEWDLFTGDSGTSEWEITVDKTVTQSDVAVTGVITLSVPELLPDGDENAVSADVQSLSDVYEGVAATSITCSAGVPPFTIDPGETVTCDYEIELDSELPGTNTATAIILDRQGNDQAFVTTEDVATFTVTPAAGSEPGTINVSDTNGMSFGPYSDDATVTYTETFSCDGDEGPHQNTASIDETDDSDMATVTVGCYSITVAKTVNTDWDRDWTWEIDKVAYTIGTEPGHSNDDLADNSAESPLVLTEGQPYHVQYDVEVEGSIATETASVSGSISVTNPLSNPISADITALSDVLSQPVAGTSNLTVDCGALVFPLTLNPGDQLNCTYEQDPATPEDGTNTATATLQNYAYDEDGVQTNNGTTDFSSDAEDVVFTLDETDECVDVDDSNAANALDPPGNPFPATFCATAGGTTMETYTYVIQLLYGPEDCGPQEVPNTSDFETNDTAATGEASETVYVDVYCPPGGCTLTPGYWKTHNESFPGGAPPDATWQLIQPSAEVSPFFLSGQTYYDVLWTAPAGNKYYNLSFHYIAAVLNGLNGASVPSDVQAAIAAATGLFATYTPDEIAALRGRNGRELRAQFVELAGILGAYNEGDGGVPHCDDDDAGLINFAELFANREAATSAAREGTSEEAASRDGRADADEQEAAAGDDAQDTTADTAEAAASQAEAALPTEYALAASYPNPFQRSTTVGFDLPESAHVVVSVYDVLGREVTRLVDRVMEEGSHEMQWDASSLAAGTYILHFRAGDVVETQSVTLTK